jgi:hypothetical protein
MEVAFCIEAFEEALARHGKPDIVFNTDQARRRTPAPSEVARREERTT